MEGHDREWLFSVKHSPTSCVEASHPNMTAFMTLNRVIAGVFVIGFGVNQR